MKKIGIPLIVVIAAVGIFWYAWKSNKTAPAQNQENNAALSATTLQTSDASNASLQSDLGQIDYQMTALESANASVDEGLNDQPVEQTE